MMKSEQDAGPRLLGLPGEELLVVVECLCGEVHYFDRQLAGRMAVCPILKTRFLVPPSSGRLVALCETPQPEAGPTKSSAKVAITTGIEILGRFWRANFLLNSCKLRVRVDSKLYSCAWAQPQVIPVHPGGHNISIFFGALLSRKAGHTEFFVNIAKGQVRRFEYRAPQLEFMRGTVLETPRHEHGEPGMALGQSAGQQRDR